MATFVKRGKTWTVQLHLTDAEGAPIRPSKSGFPTKKSAELWASEMALKYNNGLSMTSSKMLLKNLAEDWYENVYTKKVAMNTAYNTKSRLEAHIYPALGEVPLNKLNNVMIQNFYFDLGKKGLGPASSKKVMNTLTSLLKYGKKLDVLSYVPTDIEKQPITKPKIGFWTEEQLELFLKEVRGTPLYLPSLTVAMTGLRSAELMGLKWKAIDFENAMMTVEAQILKDKDNGTLIYSEILKTDSSNRTITLPAFLVNLLKDHKEGKYKGPNHFIFGDAQGNMLFYDSMRMMFKRRVLRIRRTHEEKIRKEQEEIQEGHKLSDEDINEKLLPEIKFYELRHTHATILLANGENIKVISERLGHKNIKTTLDVYASVMPRTKVKTAELLDKLFKDNL
jgi:integrase